LFIKRKIGELLKDLKELLKGFSNIYLNIFKVILNQYKTNNFHIYYDFMNKFKFQKIKNQNLFDLFHQLNKALNGQYMLEV